MTAAELLREVEALGARVVLVAPDRLRITPRRVLTPEIMEALRARKPGLIRLLSGSAPVAGALGDAGTAEAGSVLAAEVAQMPLDQFATAGLKLLVRSVVLGGEVVLFASDNVIVTDEEHRGHVVYFARELRELIGASPEDLRQIHAVKRTFKGSILADIGMVTP